MEKILLIEDEPMMAELYKDGFSKAGFRVFVAFNSKDGLKIAKKEKPDLIVLDILLPAEDGIVFLKKYKKFPEISSIPVIVFSNYDLPDVKKEALGLGVKEYLLKTNFTPLQLIDKVKEYL